MKLGVSREKLYRALLVSDLVTYIKRAVLDVYQHTAEPLVQAVELGQESHIFWTEVMRQLHTQL